MALNHDEPAVADFVVEVMEHWLRRGADGWRLDAAYAVPSSFWAPVTARVRSSHPNAYFVGEYIHGDYAAEVRSGGLDSATQYELWKAVWSSLNDANFFELAAAFERHNALLGSYAPLTFIGNHDVTRIASKLTDQRSCRTPSSSCSRSAERRPSTTATSRATGVSRRTGQGATTT